MKYLLSNLSVFVLVSLLFSAHAQAPDTLAAYNSYEKARKFYRELQNYDSAAYYFEIASGLYEKLGMPEKIPGCILGAGNSAFSSGKYQLAATRYELAKAAAEGKVIAPKIMSGIYDNLGAAYEQLGKRYLAKNNLEQGLKIRLEHFGPNHQRTATSYANLGTSYTYFGEYQKALDFYLKALPVYLENFGENSSRLSALYVNIGILYAKKRDHKRAIDYYLKANEIDKNVYGEGYMYTAYNYLNLGISYHGINNDSLAIKSFNKTAALSVKNQLHELHAASLYETGNVYYDSEQYEKALKNYEKAIERITTAYGDGHPRLSYYYNSMADIKKINKNYPEAENYLHRAIEINKKNYGEKHVNIAGNLNNLANLYRAQGKYEEALSAVDQGLIIIYPQRQFDPSLDIAFTAISDHHSFLNLLQTKAGILIDKYDHTSKDVKDVESLKSALSHFHAANKLIDHIRRGYIIESSKIFLQNRASFIYDQAIGICLRLHSITQEGNYLEQALMFSEKSKATVLAEALQASHLTGLQGIPDSVLKKERSFKERILMAENNYLGASQKSTVPGFAADLKNELFRLQRSYDSLVEKISQSYPDYYDLKHNLDVVEAGAVKDWLDGRSAILSYFIGGDNIYVFVITNRGINVHTISKDNFNGMNIKTFREKIVDQERPYQELAEASYQIYHDLLQAPLSGLQSVKRLIIIPDGALNYVPFEALLTEKTANSSAKPHYLIEDYTISYASSLSLLINRQKRGAAVQINYIGFAPNYDSHEAEYRNTLSDGNLSLLSGALEEVKRACETLAGEIYIGDDATEHNFKNMAQQPAVLHLAMHAGVDDNDPMQSKLLFTREADSVEDGSLNAYEIYSLKLSSQLAVLSACNTGYGEIQRGEGIMSLSRAFKYAGCPNIVMSLWRAKDQPSNQIISGLFDNLKKKMPKDEALRQAKLDYLKSADPLQAHPANWATLVLLGNAEPVQFIPEYNWLQTGLILVVLILLFTMIARKYYLHKGG